MNFTYALLCLVGTTIGGLANILANTQSGAPVKIILEAVPPKIHFDGISTSNFNASVVDAIGNLATTFSGNIYFSISGAGSLLGQNPVIASSGKGYIVFKSDKTGSNATVTATSPGLISAAVTITTCCSGTNLKDIDLSCSAVECGPSTNKEMLCSFNASNNERIKVWCVSSGLAPLTGGHFELLYYPPISGEDVKDGKLAGFCLWHGGYNEFKFKGYRDNSSSQNINCIAEMSWTNYDLGYNDLNPNSEYINILDFTFDPCAQNGYYRLRQNVKYSEIATESPNIHCTKDANGKWYCTSVSPLSKCTAIASNMTHTIDTNHFKDISDSLLGKLADSVSRNSIDTVSTASIKQIKYCDLNADGKCDSNDVAIFNIYKNHCKGDSLYNPLLDMDFDDCITNIDSVYIFSVSQSDPTGLENSRNGVTSNSKDIIFNSKNNVLHAYFQYPSYLKSIAILSLDGKVIGKIELMKTVYGQTEWHLSSFAKYIPSQVLLILVKEGNAVKLYKCYKSM